MDEILKEARRLYREGFAIHWLRPKSKVPVEAGWTTGPRKKWKELEANYHKGMNVGVRLGEASTFDDRHLVVIDLDVKSKDPRHLKEALIAARQIRDGKKGAVVFSGRGDGSRHYYFATKKTFRTYKANWSDEKVKVFMPSAGRPSKIELAQLSSKEIAQGWRIRNAWEIGVMCEGSQVVLPPSIHPDSGKRYRWARPFGGATRLPLIKPDSSVSTALPESAGTEREEGGQALKNFSPVRVDIGWLDISEQVRNGILTGDGVTDRSAFLMKAAMALFSAGLDQNEVLSVLTDRNTYLGEVGYDHAKTDSRRRAAEWVHRYSVKRVATEKSTLSVFQNEVVPARTLTKEEMREQAGALESERHWTQDLICGKAGIVLHLLQNTVLVLENAIPKATIRRDDFAYRDAYARNTPWGGKKDEHVSDDDIAKIKYWMGKSFNFEPSSNSISDALVVVATQNSFDPVRDFLDTLPEWDGCERLNGWLPQHFEARGDHEYLAQVFRKWMVAMVMRVYHPGAKFDWMPIFEGPQNMGKSSFGRILVGEKYFLDWLPNLSDKDAALALQGMWGVEFGELTQFRKNELEIIKGFVSRTVDKVRPPYGRRMIEHARRCVFFGTTNKETYLIDETGNRRFKPIVVGRLNFKQLKKDRLQLFAEAKHLWTNEIETGLTLELSGAARVFESRIHGQKMVADDSDAMMEMMRDFVEKVVSEDLNFDLGKFRILDLFKGVGPLAGWRADNRNFQFAGKMLKKFGAEKRIIRGFIYWKTTPKDEIGDFF